MTIGKGVVWLGSTLDDLRQLPEEVRGEVGYALDRAQRRLPHPSVKVLAGLTGVQEVRVDHDHSTYRTVYVVNLPDALYVLHCFQKKSRQGIATPQHEIELIRSRLKLAQKLSREEQSHE
ncbi:hypothetical protein Dxin01_03433 [Deinococcus xinjiangensis]|uniref:Addiction module toxin RelE n=1 Tax=Deinococcus xinjiangensis TaxID=457454 RepID=A0ABP9VHW5_9DEIO